MTRAASSCRQSCYPCTQPGEVLLAWRRSCFEYAVFEDGSETFDDDALAEVIERSFATWTDVECPETGERVQMTVRQSAEPSRCGVPEYAEDGPNSNTFVFAQDWTERGHARGAFALTTTWFDRGNGEIFDADLEINEERFDFGICPAGGCEDGRIDLQNTLTHEIGHIFGIAHSNANEETTMWACAEEGETLKRDLEGDDVDAFCSIYAPGQLDDSCNFRPRGGFDARCEAERPGCGCRAPGLGGTSGAPGFVVAFLSICLWRRRRASTR